MVKTKVTIWADSTIMESALSLFLLKLLADINKIKIIYGNNIPVVPTAINVALKAHVVSESEL